MSTHKPEADAETAADTGFVPRYLLYLLAAASDVLSAEFHSQLRARGIRVPEWRTLACLADDDGQMVTQLASLALMEQSRLTKIIDQMADKGLVSRRSDERDRRRVRVFLTPLGRDLSNQLVTEARAHEAGIIDQISPKQAAILKDALARIIDMHGPDAHRAGGLHSSGHAEARDEVGNPPEGDAPSGLAHRVIQPEGWERPKGYANAVMAAGGMICTGGLVGWDADGRFPQGFVAQARQTFLNIREVLEAAGAGPEHLVRLTWYVTSIDNYAADPEGLGAAYRDVFGRCFPAMATVEVTRLVERDALLEIEATAVISKGQDEE